MASTEDKTALSKKIERLCKCDRILSYSDIPTFGIPSKDKKKEDEDIYDKRDDCNIDLEAEYFKLTHVLDLPEVTHSLTKIETNLPLCLKYGFRSGLTHMHMQKFSPFTRGYQGPAMAVAAIATGYLIKPHCWNEPVIDQIIEDGDTYCSYSYEKIKIDDRRALTLLDLKRNLYIRKTHRVTVKIDDPIYAGTFRSETPKDLHVAKALELFFAKYDTGVLTSSVLNIAIWKGSKYYYIFDAQARLENCEIADPKDDGAAKLMLVHNLQGVLFIILEKSNVQNEPFVLYGVTITDVRKICELPDKTELITQLIEPTRRPSGYRIHDKFRAVVQGSYHLNHPILPREFQGRGHLVLAVAALIYTKLVSGSKWTKVMIDLIFNQSNIYLTDIARILGKSLDNNFEMTVKDLLCDVVLGVYTIKIKVHENVFPGPGGKTKGTMDVSMRQFFASHSLGIIEIKKIFYAIWKEKNKFYLLDPFSCDSEGFRVSSSDPTAAERYKKATACLTMNSTINQLMELILENTESKDKDPIIIHGISVLYIKTDGGKGEGEKVIFREKQTNRRPQAPSPPPSIVTDDCMTVIDTLPKLRYVTEFGINEVVQYPEVMHEIELFVNVFDHFKFEENDKEPNVEETISSGYGINNPHRLMLKGTRNCLDKQYSEPSRGRQGLVIGVTAIAQAKQISPAEWTSIEIDNIITDGNVAYERVVSWIHRGSPEDEFDDEPVAEESIEEKVDSNIMDKQNMCKAPGAWGANAKSIVKGLEYLKLSMMPKQIKIGDNALNLNWQMNVFEGDTNPLANLGEALERYFAQFDELILENNRLLYGVWKNNDKYFVLNPYGCDDEGWKTIQQPAALFVVDSILELVNFFYGVLEYNNHHFMIHYVSVRLQQHNGNMDDDPSLNDPVTEAFQLYKTKFLPVTNADIDNMNAEKELKAAASAMALQIEDQSMEEENSQVLGDSFNSYESKETLEEEEDLTDLFEPVKEPEPSDTPIRLNLALVTGVVKVEHTNGEEEYEEMLEIFYEKLKYKHPPPFVTPPKKNLCNLLDIKLASKSIHSLLSRFSIDSKLAIKERTDVIQSPIQDATISLYNMNEKSKLITLPMKKYLYSISLPSGLTPIRAINEQFIQDKRLEEEKEEECRNKKLECEIKMVAKSPSELSTNIILPLIIPLGPCIKTPKPKKKYPECVDKAKKKCNLSKRDKNDDVMKKLVCSTENLLFEMIFPDFKQECDPKVTCGCEDAECRVSIAASLACIKTCTTPEPCGFMPTDDENIGIITGNMSLEDRDTFEESHYKSCYYSAILCILAKINLNVNEFRGTILDRFVAAAEKITEGTGKLRYIMTRWFRNFNILGVKCNVILKQVQYADPENYEPDELSLVLKCFFNKHQTGIIVFGNVSFAFWTVNDIYYLFDPYACDENGRPQAEGSACIMEICCFEAFIQKLIQNSGESVNKPYRVYTIAIAHLEKNKKPKSKKKKKQKCCKEELDCDSDSECTEETEEPKELESDTSLIELADWVKDDCSKFPVLDTSLPGFLPVENYNASAIEVEVLENEITRPIQAPIKDDTPEEPIRIATLDKKFYENSILEEPLDLCIMAWSQIYEPPIWSKRTIQALYEASKDYTFDCLLASEDSTVECMKDDLLMEFTIANYSFRIVFAPIHAGTLYANEGWNLAMSLDKIFDSPVYTGGIIVCEEAHVGVMKLNNKFYAWWTVKWTKNLRIIVSEDMQDYLKLVTREINKPGETEFAIRIVTISYAKILGPDCSDLEGLHESMMPSTAVAEIHRKNINEYDVEAIYRPIELSRTPLFVLGSVVLAERDLLTEPQVKRCYFVALLASILKRDIIQNPIPGMVDKILELGDNLYKLLYEPKYHSEHLIKDVNLMDRVFDLRDCAYDLVSLLDDKIPTSQNFFPAVHKHLKMFFKKCTSGIIHFTNCCYGFWYSETTHCYYYLDPYQCNSKGKRVATCGKSCLCVFPSVCQMVKNMCANQYKETTGFFIHRVHVELVNASPYEKFQEDPIWTYLDYHWCHRHLGKRTKSKHSKGKKTKEPIATEEKKPVWKNYLIEVPNLIYSVWGTISAFDVRFGPRAGKNQAAIAIAMLAMRNICHPSEWTSAVLDSAVICGDSYYKESKKAPTRCYNRFRLAEVFKVAPYIWNIEFLNDICGVLYSSGDQPSLADIIEISLKRLPNLLVQCKKKIVMIAQTADAFYAMDSSWTGPPLFYKNRGAIYVIRCKNISTLVYVVTKMLNTNQRLEIQVTAVKIAFKQETCQSSDSKPKINRKKFLEKPVNAVPGETLEHSALVTGSEAVPDEDSYLCYSRNLKMGLARGEEFENADKILLSDDQKAKKEKEKKICKNAKTTKKQSAIMHGIKAEFKNAKSISNILEQRVSHIKILNLVKEVGKGGKGCTRIRKPCKPGPEPEKFITKNEAYFKLFGIHRSVVDCPEKAKLSCQKKKFDIKKSFICDETEEMFDLYNTEMQKDIYKTFRHAPDTIKEEISAENEMSAENEISVAKEMSVTGTGGPSTSEIDGQDGEEDENA